MSQLNQKHIKYNWHEADASMMEGIFARGDRRLSKVILKAYEKGCIYDAWSEYFDFEKWMDTFKECEIDPFFYTTRQRSEDEIFPWDILDCGVTKAFLLREWKTALAGNKSSNCRQKCLGCGAASYGVGVCKETRTNE
jgi:hypothetical protein